VKDAAATYRWNTSAAAEAFDAAAEYIHPFYVEVQDAILASLHRRLDQPAVIVDLGGGSGRLVERMLTRLPSAIAILIDQSEPFLALAERRLQPFGTRATLVKRRLQDDWRAELPGAVQGIVSMSAIHHLDLAEKRELFQHCCQSLAPGGIFLNGDEHRPEADAEYLARLEWWANEMNSAMARGRIPTSFAPVFETWYDRNVRRFGEPKQSGDDCLETVAAQVGYLSNAGFAEAQTVWAKKLWAVIQASRPDR
jgi:SAM-dependent methyltransferase